MGDEQLYADTRMDACEVDPGLYAAHRLTPDQRRHFDEQGYLLIEDALPPDLFHECKRLLLGMAADEVAKGAHAAAGTDRGGFAAVTAACFSQANHLQRTALAKLLTTEKVLPKIIDIMGCNTTCYHFHCNVTSSMGGSVLDEGDDSDGGAPLHPDFQGVPCFGYHQDSGLQADCEHRPAPRFSMKAGYFFTDVPPGAANTWIVPRSHLLEQELERPEIGQPKGAIPIVCKANTCLLFDRRLYHAATPNWVSECQQTIIASHHQRLALAFVVGLAHQ
jgi:ectoine hydroxylase